MSIAPEKMSSTPNKKVQNGRAPKRKRFGELFENSGSPSPQHAAAGHGTGDKGITGASPPASNSHEETSEDGLMELSFLPRSQAQPQMEPKTPQIKGERVGRKAEARNNRGGSSTQSAVLKAFFDYPEAKPKSAVLDSFFSWTPPAVEAKEEDKKEAQEAQPELVVQEDIPKAPEEDGKALIEGENQEDEAWHNQAYLESPLLGSPLQIVTEEGLLSESPFCREEEGIFQEVPSPQSSIFPYKLDSRVREEPDMLVTPSKTCNIDMLMSNGAVGGLEEQCNLPHELSDTPDAQYATQPVQYDTPHGQYSMPYGQCSMPPGQSATPCGQYAMPRGQYAVPHVQYGSPHGQCSVPHMQCDTPIGQYDSPHGHYSMPHVQCDTPHLQYAMAHEQIHTSDRGCHMTDLQNMQYVPQHALHYMPNSPPCMENVQRGMSNQHDLPFVPCDPCTGIHDLGMAPYEAGEPDVPNVEACVTERALSSSFGDLPGDSFGGMEASGRDDFQETVGTPVMDSILQAVMEYGEGAPECSSRPRAIVPKDQGQQIKWKQPPAKMLGGPGPSEPGCVSSGALVKVDFGAENPGNWSCESDWKNIPGVQRNDELIVDEDNVFIFKHAQADFRRTVSICADKEMARVKASHGSARPDLKAMQEFDDWMFQEPIIGHLPGLEINTIFQYKAEMHVLGVHKGHSRGISYVSAKKAKPGVPIALSICMSSQYAFDEDNFQEAWYTGEGGNLAMNCCNKPRKGQEVARGNQALTNNIRLRLPVRVVKKLSDRKFVYDGLWDVVDWVMGDEYGKMVYKFKLSRRSQQEISLLLEAPFYSEEPAPMEDFSLGKMTDDLSCGKERNPIPVVNTVDWELAPGIEELDNKFSGPAEDFEYGIEFRYSPYVCEKVAPPRPLVYKLQVFRKLELDDDGLGWGVRTLEHIAANSYILTLVGKIIHLAYDVVEDDDVHCHDLHMRTPTDMEKSEEESVDIDNREVAFAVSAYSYGNVGRFVDHDSTSPNTVLQPTLSRDPSVWLTNMCLYSITDIQPGEEITYDQFRKEDCFFQTDDEDGFE